MNKIVERLKKEFSKTPDLIVKEIKLNMFNTLFIIYLETVSSSNKVNDYILKNVIDNKDKINKNNFQNYLAGPNTKRIDKYDKIEYFLTNGFTIVILKDNIYGVETRADINRAVANADIETSINGPKDSFTENYQINIGLIKRRLKSHNLKIDNRVIGRKTSTQVGVLYFEDIADQELVQNILEKLDNIDIDGVIDSSSIGYLLGDEESSVYPTFLQTERPDMVSTSLLEGKIAIVMDTTPFALIIPAFFIDFINPNIDNYSKSKNINFIKILRIFAYFLSMIAPALYIAVMNYNQETIPTNLLIDFAIQRNGVPFPTIVETILMLAVCEILRESDLRFPSNYGSAISILGAIVLGEASVSAGIASPITIIVIAITFISSLTFSNVEINNSLRFFRFIFIILAGFFGLYGITLGLLFFLIYTSNITSFGKPYFAPFAPFDKVYFHNTVFKIPLKKDKIRSSMLTKTNKTKQR
ncbi:MAG TPA: spore germination protein [Candidatus Onthocola stercorigallinarum]|nr:spore germination protein [Candidatus Onthocola stercorigallinarum]